MRCLIVLAWLTTFGSARMALSSPALATAGEIDRRCRKAEAETRSKPWRVFAEVSQVDTGALAEVWREFSSPAALKDAGRDGPPDTQAFVWRFIDGVLLVQMVFQSGSGDWMHVAEHCYRPDGSLASVRDTLNTFNAGQADQEIETGNDGGVSRIRIRIFDRDGQLLRKTSRLLDLTTKKPVRRSFMDQEDAIYKRVSDLPFHRSLKERQDTRSSRTDRK